MTTETEAENQNGAGDGTSSDEKASKIVKQVEYYFGDINLPRDRFLLEQTKAKNGWVSLATMLKFNRLMQISDQVEEIAAALKNSSLMEVNENADAIRRRPSCPLPENTLEYWMSVKKRTVYVNGFPQDASIDELLTFFGGKGQIVNLLMRKTKQGEPRVFKGSVFVTFSDEETAHKFAESDDKLEYKGQLLDKMMQEQYWAKKNQEMKEKKEAEKLLKKAKKEEVANEQVKSIKAVHFVKGIVLKVSGLPKQATFPEIKEFFNRYGHVAFVRLTKDDEGGEAYVRFSTDEEYVAQKVWDKCVQENDGKVEMTDADGKKHELTAYVITGGEESYYWVDFNNQKLKTTVKNNKRNKKKGKDGQPIKIVDAPNPSRKRFPKEDDFEDECTPSKKIVLDTIKNEDTQGLDSDANGTVKSDANVKNEENQSDLEIKNET